MIMIDLDKIKSRSRPRMNEGGSVHEVEVWKLVKLIRGQDKLYADRSNILKHIESHPQSQKSFDNQARLVTEYMYCVLKFSIGIE